MKRSTLEKAYDTYSKQIEKYALERFNAVVKPYLQKNNYDFLCQLGWGWGIFGNGKRIPEEKIPQNVLFELEFAVPGLGRDVVLAYWMPDYDGKE